MKAAAVGINPLPLLVFFLQGNADQPLGLAAALAAENNLNHVKSLLIFDLVRV